jgi:Domain of unknown function (DUF4352)
MAHSRTAARSCGIRASRRWAISRARWYEGSAAALFECGRSSLKKLGIIVGVGFLLFVACDDLRSGTSDTQDSATSQPTTAKQPAEQPPPAEEAQDGTAEEPAPEVEKVATVGQPARDGNFEFVVTGVEPPVKSLGEGFAEEEAQGEFVIVRVEVSNIGKDPRSLSSGSQYAYAGEARYADTLIIGLEGADRAFVENINPGNKVTEVPLVFDVPPGTKLTQVELHDSPFSGGVQVNL